MIMNNITEMLERNAREWGDDVALVEIDTPDSGRHTTWKDAELVESVKDRPYRREMTWRTFDEKANRFANFLLSRGFKKGDKIAILLMNGLEWLPVYFGVLKAGCMAVRWSEAIRPGSDVSAGPGMARASSAMVMALLSTS